MIDTNYLAQIYTNALNSQGTPVSYTHLRAHAT